MIVIKTCLLNRLTLVRENFAYPGPNTNFSRTKLSISLKNQMA